MPRRKAKVGPIQKFCSYAILATLGLIFVWLLFQQFRFNPAVLAALQGVQLKGRPQAASGESTAAAAALFPEVPGFSPLAPVQSFGPDNLSDKIDGKAELYLSAGFARMSCRSFNVGIQTRPLWRCSCMIWGLPPMPMLCSAANGGPVPPASP